MADPIAAPGAALMGTAAAIPAAAIAGTLFGVPYELLAWGFFGGLIAIANVERTQTGWRLALNLAGMLAFAAGVSGASAGLVADIVTGLITNFINVHLSGSADPRLVRCMAIAIGAATALIPDGYAFARRRLNKQERLA
jgi:hypothetical protein